MTLSGASLTLHLGQLSFVHYSRFHLSIYRFNQAGIALCVRVQHTYTYGIGFCACFKKWKLFMEVIKLIVNIWFVAALMAII